MENRGRPITVLSHVQTYFPHGRYAGREKLLLKFGYTHAFYFSWV